MKQILARSSLCCLLIVSLSAVVFAQSSSPSMTSNQFLTNSGAAAKANDKLKSDVVKMVADTRARPGGPPPMAQFPTPQRNNLSKTAKIAIVAGVVLVIVAIVIVHEARQFHCESRCVL